jgi:hypothetical protein
MATNDEQVEEKPKAEAKAEPKAPVKEKAVKEEEQTDVEYVNILSVVSQLFGMPASRVKEMIGAGSMHIDSERWYPEGSFSIPLSSIEGKLVEIISQPTSIKFTFDSEHLDEYRTSVN